MARFIGNLTASSEAVPGGRLHYRHIELCKIRALKECKGDYESSCTLSDKAKTEIIWWVENITNSFAKMKSTQKIDYTIYTDASNFDYKDALLNSLYAQVDYLRKDSLQKTAIITTLIKNKVNNPEMIENTTDDNLEPAIRHTMNLNSETENKMPSNVPDTGNNPEMIENTIDDNLEPVIRHTMNLNTETENKIQSHVSDTGNAYKHDSNDNVTKSNINRGLERKYLMLIHVKLYMKKNYVNDSNDGDVRGTNNIETRNIFDVLTVNDCDQGNQGYLNNDDIYSNISITSDDES